MDTDLCTVHRWKSKGCLMPKEQRRLGVDRMLQVPSPEHHAPPAQIQGVRVPERMPAPNLDVSLEDLVARQEAVSPVAQVSLPVATQGAGTRKIPLDLIDVSPFQPRLVISEEALGRLADSIQAAGRLRRPILVRPMPGGRYELVGGERRWRAHYLLHWAEIEADVREMSDEEAELNAVADNQGGEDLCDFELARAYNNILEKGIEPSMSALARRVGVNQSTISRCLGYLKLPASVQALLEKNPSLVGPKQVLKFVELSAANEVLVLEAVAGIGEGRFTQEGAVRWVQSAISGGRGAGAESRTLFSKGRPLGSIKVTGSKVELSCVKGVDSTKLAELVSRYLETVELG